MTARDNACAECGVTHGPGNTNTLCPRASNYDVALAGSLARDNAETADLTLEVGRLRRLLADKEYLLERYAVQKDRLEDAEGLLRAMYQRTADADVLSWLDGIPDSLAQAKPAPLLNNAGVRAAAAELDVERLRGELNAARADAVTATAERQELLIAERAEVGSLREQLKESEGKCRALTVESEGWARQLTEATALLERVDDELITDPSDDPVTLQLDHDLGVFLGRIPRAPAQPAAPEPGADRIRMLEAALDNDAHHGARVLELATENSALRDRVATLLKERTEDVSLRRSAEAQLAAVLAACLEVCPNGRSSVHISTAVLWPLLTPAPSPGSRPGQERKVSYCKDGCGNTAVLVEKLRADLATVTAEREALRTELLDNRNGLHKEVARCGQLKAALEQAPYQAFLNEQRAHAETRKALEYECNAHTETNARLATITANIVGSDPHALPRALAQLSEAESHCRALSEHRHRAEAQLAAVRYELDCYAEFGNSEYLYSARRLLTPAPSPGAGEKT